MLKKLAMSFFCLCFVISVVGTAAAQNGKMVKALEKIINAGPDKFESLRASEWEAPPGQPAAKQAKGKVGIPGIENCRMDDLYGFAYICSLSDISASRAKELYQEIKASLPSVVPDWKFKAEELSGITQFFGGPTASASNFGSAVNVTYFCKDQNSNSCYVSLRVEPRNYTAADVRNIKSKPDKNKKNLPPCEMVGSVAGSTLNIVTTVKPEAGKTWKFPEAPSVVAARLLQALNKNTRNIVFTEANGVTPNYYFNVIVTESSEGTRRASASVEVTGLGKPGILFRESSGAAPFTGVGYAIDQLGLNMQKWFENGWTKNRPPCTLTDGSVLNP